MKNHRIHPAAATVPYRLATAWISLQHALAFDRCVNKQNRTAIALVSSNEISIHAIM